MSKTIIFDLDGTLLDTLDDLADSVNFALDRKNLPLRSREEVRHFVGNGIRALVHRSVPDDCPAELEEKVFAEFKEHYILNCKVKTKPYAGIEELLIKLKADGFKLGVVSNKADTAVKELMDFYFPNMFDTVCGEKENVRKKPAPDSVFESIRQLKSTTEETLYIGDSDVDFLTSKNAGTRCILVSWGFRERTLLEKLGADAIADNAAELYAEITEMMQ